MRNIKNSEKKYRRVSTVTRPLAIFNWEVLDIYLILCEILMIGAADGTRTCDPRRDRSIL